LGSSDCSGYNQKERWQVFFIEWAFAKKIGDRKYRQNNTNKHNGTKNNGLFFCWIFKPIFFHSKFFIFKDSFLLQMISKGSPIIFLCHPYTTLRVHPKLSQQQVVGADTDHGGRIYSFNPVTAGFVAEPWHWIYSSARDYHTDKKG